MKFQTFLQNSIHQSLLSSANKIIFVVPDQLPVLFFTEFLKKMKKCTGSLVEHLDLGKQEESFIKSRIEMVGFFNNKAFYWLGNITDLSLKKRKSWVAYIEKYKGSHALGLCVGSKDSLKFGKEWLRVDIPPVVDRSDFELLAQLFYTEKAAIHKKLSRTFAPSVRITLDKAILLLHYSQVLGSNVRQFREEWLPILVESEESLFKVSQYLLSKRADNFFRLWSKVGSQYPDVFWIAYWSDILWRSYSYIQLMQKNDSFDAKRISYRLPFSFINGGWKKINSEELKNAHHFIYNLDYNIKNGAGTYGLELLYSKFFQGEFAVNKKRGKNEESRTYIASSTV